MKSNLFSAKVLLFGEYGLIQNSKGLTLPFDFYKGTLKYGSNLNEESTKSNQNLKQFSTYLQNQFGELDCPVFNFQKLNEDLKNLMYFDSTIPQGYGIGSSGALVASIYDKYAINKIVIDKNSFEKECIQKLKSIFSIMESYFHGKSSGIDPLICYLNIPLIINSKDDINFAKIELDANGKGAVFLIDTYQIGKTAPMVELFFNKLKNKGFRKTLTEEFIKYNNDCIDNFIKGEYANLFKNLKFLSAWVFDNLKPMIPSKMFDLWEQGIKTNSYYLKLCGSGNGGYLLGFTEDLDLAKPLLKDHKIELLFRF